MNIFQIFAFLDMNIFTPIYDTKKARAPHHSSNRQVILGYRLFIIFINN